MSLCVCGCNCVCNIFLTFISQATLYKQQKFWNSYFILIPKYTIKNKTLESELKYEYHRYNITLQRII